MGGARLNTSCCGRSHRFLPNLLIASRAGTEFRDFAIQSMTGSSGRQRVPAESLSYYLVVTPSKEIAARFGQTIRPLFSRSSDVARESRALAALRDALLPKLISGELQLNDAESVLRRVLHT